jgi:hypothetical protein
MRQNRGFGLGRRRTLGASKELDGTLFLKALNLATIANLFTWGGDSGGHVLRETTSLAEAYVD